MSNKKRMTLEIISMVFVFLTVLVKTNLIEKFDTAIYNLITFKMTNFLTTFYKFFTFLGSTIFIVSLTVVLFFLFLILKKKNTSFIIAIVIIISTLVNNVIKLVIRRERPIVLRLVEEKSFSFPSGHTMAAVTMYGILLYLVLKSNMNKHLKRIFSIILALIPILVSLSRVYLGAHFASDVFGAFLMSIILLLIETYYIDKNNWL